MRIHQLQVLTFVETWAMSREIGKDWFNNHLMNMFNAESLLVFLCPIVSDIRRKNVKITTLEITIENGRKV